MSKLITGEQIRTQLNSANSPLQKALAHLNIIAYLKNEYKKLIDNLNNLQSQLREKLEKQVVKTSSYADNQSIIGIDKDKVREEYTTDNLSLIKRIQELNEKLTALVQQINKLDGQIAIKQAQLEQGIVKAQNSFRNFVISHLDNQPVEKQQVAIERATKVINTELADFLDKTPVITTPQLKPSFATNANKWAKKQQEEDLNTAVSRTMTIFKREIFTEINSEIFYIQSQRQISDYFNFVIGMRNDLNNTVLEAQSYMKQANELFREYNSLTSSNHMAQRPNFSRCTL